jgi:hypothetical protein
VTPSSAICRDHAPVAENQIEYEDAKALILGVWDANRKLDEILRFLYDDDDGEEEETVPDA